MFDSCVQWCPPCRALLPELRKASIQLAGQMKFGTLDCTIHHNLCSMVSTHTHTDCTISYVHTTDRLTMFCLSVSQYNIQAYPTTVIFNGSSVHEYEGQHSADGILDFIQVRLYSNYILIQHETHFFSAGGGSQCKSLIC